MAGNKYKQWKLFHFELDYLTVPVSKKLKNKRNIIVQKRSEVMVSLIALKYFFSKKGIIYTYDWPLEVMNKLQILLGGFLQIYWWFS